MTILKKISLLALLSLLFISCKNKQTENQVEVVNHRIVSLNGAITEILVALGEKDKIVGVDVTSTYPKDIKEKTQDLGHARSVSLENVIALQPTLVLASDKDLNPELITKLQDTKIEIKIIYQEQSIEGTKQFIKDIATAVGDTDYTSLIEKIDTDFAGLTQFEAKPKVLFIYARGAGTLMVAGKNTPMEKIITIAGGENAVSDFEDFKPLTPEALIQSNPDYILMFEKGLESLGGIDGVLKIQGIEQTNAGKNNRIIAMDGALLSGFGPRVGQAAKELNQLISK
ncbi:MAG: hemin ABC transporter substrate-binding protein [Flavobacteriaceae bacterium]